VELKHHQESLARASSYSLGLALQILLRNQFFLLSDLGATYMGMVDHVNEVSAERNHSRNHETPLEEGKTFFLLSSQNSCSDLSFLKYIYKVVLLI
jgi:hypothetical protein